jgi:hypothetical protein
VRAEFGRLGLRRPGHRHKGLAVASAVRPRTVVAFLVLGMLVIAASWVDAGTAASPDPDPSAKESKAPAPDTYEPPASQSSTPSTPEPVTETVTPPVIQVESTPSTGTGTVNRTPAKPATHTESRARTQKKPAKEPEKTAAPSTPRREPARLAVATPTSDDGGPLLLGGIGMALLAIASGSLLLLVKRAGDPPVGRRQPRAYLITRASDTSMGTGGTKA